SKTRLPRYWPGASRGMRKGCGKGVVTKETDVILARIRPWNALTSWVRRCAEELPNDVFVAHPTRRKPRTEQPLPSHVCPGSRRIAWSIKTQQSGRYPNRRGGLGRHLLGKPFRAARSLILKGRRRCERGCSRSARPRMQTTTRTCREGSARPGEFRPDQIGRILERRAIGWLEPPQRAPKPRRFARSAPATRN